MLKLFRKIRKLKSKELNELIEKLEVIESRKLKLWHDQFDNNSLEPWPVINLEDIEQAFTFCIYHFKGGFYDELGEVCPCNCHCESCEMIPTNNVGKRMQEIGEEITEENVIFELINNGYAKRLSTQDLKD